MNRFVLLLSAALVAASTSAQFPAKPIRLVVGVPAGSTADAQARILAQGLAESLGQPVLMENKPGAEMAIAAEAVRDAATDGHALGYFGFTSMVTTPLLNKHVTFDSRKDFAPISLVGRMTMSLSVNPAIAAKSLGELIDYARANPGKLNYASVGSVDTLLAGMLMKATNTSMTRVSYKGPVQSLQDLMAGRIDVAINPMGAQVELAKNGCLRILAVFGASRDADVPDVPTMTESRVPEVSFDGMWFGLFGPAKMASERINRLAQEVDQLLKRPDLREKLIARSLKPESSTPDALGALLKADFERWSKIAKELGLAAM